MDFLEYLFSEARIPYLDRWPLLRYKVAVFAVLCTVTLITTPVSIGFISVGLPRLVVFDRLFYFGSDFQGPLLLKPNHTTASWGFFMPLFFISSYLNVPLALCACLDELRWLWTNAVIVVLALIFSLMNIYEDYKTLQRKGDYDWHESLRQQWRLIQGNLRQESDSDEGFEEDDF